MRIQSLTPVSLPSRAVISASLGPARQATDRLASAPDSNPAGVYSPTTAPRSSRAKAAQDSTLDDLKAQSRKYHSGLYNITSVGGIGLIGFPVTFSFLASCGEAVSAATNNLALGILTSLALPVALVAGGFYCSNKAKAYDKMVEAYQQKVSTPRSTADGAASHVAP